MSPEFFGKTPIRRSCGTVSDFFVWATVDECGKVESIYYGISSLMACAQGPVLRSNCQSPIERALLAFADHRAINITFDDGVVIENC